MDNMKIMSGPYVMHEYAEGGRVWFDSHSDPESRGFVELHVDGQETIKLPLGGAEDLLTNLSINIKAARRYAEL